MKVLAFEDSVDIEALLIGNGVDLSKVEFKQYWESVDHLDRILQFDPDVLMLDHYMPPTKGLDVLVNLLKSNIKKPQTIVAMSSSSMANIAMLKTGADFGIVKFKVSELEIWTHHS
jgi:DNA-binding response OmpR family regulator|tara:strand:+ start:345 stop:692 length:348 start_codon:yes stop_codon:yes gene_type:complete